MTVERDIDREKQFLTEAARGNTVFAAHAQARLAAQDEEYGTSWAWIGVRKLLAEALEEAADIGAWCALCEQAVDLDPTLDGDQREQLHTALLTTASAGAVAHRTIALGAVIIDALK